MDGKAILVTGANGGIGAALTGALAERGWTVYAGVRPGRTAPTGQRVRPVTIDVADPAGVTAAAEEIGRARRGSGLQAIVNNAGVIVQGPVELVPEAEWQRQFDVNVHGPVRVMQAFLPLLRAGSGRVVNVSAISARVAMPLFGPVSASKAALESLSDAARVELAAWGVPVVLVELGAMDTGIFAKAETAASAALARAPRERLALYQLALDAFAKALAGQKPSPVETAVKVLVQAVEARRPNPRYLAGRDARGGAVLARLPLRARDRVLARITGLSGVTTPAATPPAPAARRAS